MYFFQHKHIYIYIYRASAFIYYANDDTKQVLRCGFPFKCFHKFLICGRAKYAAPYLILKALGAAPYLTLKALGAAPYLTLNALGAAPYLTLNALGAAPISP